jgi:hypothetical protein
MSSAQETALATVEVLENILLSLDIQTILTSAQRVCHKWRDLVTTSPYVQKHIFFQPDWDQKHKQQNPLLASIFPGWFSHDHTIPREKMEDQGTLDIESEGIKSSIDLDQPDVKASFKHQDASWRHMLVQQPPVLDLVQFRVESSRGGSWLGGPYLYGLDVEDTSVKDLYSQALAISNPLRMDDFVDWVPWLGVDEFHRRMILWDDKDVQIPSEFEYYSFDQEEKRRLREALETFGIIAVRYYVVQCAMGSNHGPRMMKRRFLSPSSEIRHGPTRVKRFKRSHQ